MGSENSILRIAIQIRELRTVQWHSWCTILWAIHVDLRTPHCTMSFLQYYTVSDIWRPENPILCCDIHTDNTLVKICGDLRTPYCAVAVAQTLYCARCLEIWELRIVQCHSRRSFTQILYCAKYVEIRELHIAQCHSCRYYTVVCARYVEIWELCIVQCHSRRYYTVLDMRRSENSILRSDIHADTALC